MFDRFFCAKIMMGMRSVAVCEHGVATSSPRQSSLTHNSFRVMPVHTVPDTVIVQRMLHPNDVDLHKQVPGDTLICVVVVVVRLFSFDAPALSF